MTAIALDVEFTATLVQSPAKGGWTYVVWPGSAAYFGTRGLVKVREDVLDRAAVRGCRGELVEVLARLRERVVDLGLDPGEGA